ncbi:AAA family ATPase [Malaciobacter marinus]|uniref:AAA family ATPase n=1 Tax=Malaciobacter marinus TaxID=505249 RepID=UPI003B007C9B
MGSLVIKKISYTGDKYYFESPEFTTGINIIEGDNGSGKSTFSYFIEYALGGDIPYFSKTNKNEKYKEIVNDTNNSVELIVLINGIEYTFQRYINKNDIFVKFLDGRIKKYCVLRQHCSDEVFSDWLLSKLNIKRFELSLGASSWYFNFNDIFRLINYDQDTDPKKIYKAPNSENFVTDSLIIRKSIFETLMGTSSDEYFFKMNELNEAKIAKQEAKYSLDEFEKENPNLKLTLESVKIEEESLIEQMQKLVESRNEYQKENTKVDDKFKNIEESKAELIRLELQNSQDTIMKKNLDIEKDKINKLLLIQKNEISSINKSIFTHEKLNLFDFEICPFCAKSVEKEDKKCLCGNIISENNYEKFLYDSSEYKEILKHKEKSLESINLSLTSIDEEIKALDEQLNNNKSKIEELNKFIKSAIESIEYSGNSKIVESIDNKIAETKEKINKSQELVKIYKLKETKEKNFSKKDSAFKLVKESFESMQKQYVESNQTIISNFNEIYNDLMEKSSCKATSAYIDEDYNPILDGGNYREKSAIVPKRMMYYFTLISMALKYENIKHPKFLLMDTPEEAGIDDINTNIKLFDNALELSKKFPEDKIGDFQFILTTGHNNRCPKEYEQFIKLRFRKTEGIFILKEKH